MKANIEHLKLGIVTIEINRHDLSILCMLAKNSPNFLIGVSHNGLVYTQPLCEFNLNANRIMELNLKAFLKEGKNENKAEEYESLLRHSYKSE